MKSKKLIALLCALTLLLSAVPMVFADVDDSITQEEAIKIVKGVFDTTAFDVFDIDYSEYRDRIQWNLHWSKNQEPYASLTASVDAEDGSILSLYSYRGYDPNRRTPILPELKESEAREIAETFIAGIQPREFSSSELVEEKSHDVRPLGGPNFVEDYSFAFRRIEGGIPVEGNGFEISVDANTGDVLRYRYEWGRESLPKGDDIIPRNRAEEVFSEKQGLELIYNRYFDFKSKEEDVKLVYRVKNPGVLIDAFTGEIIGGPGLFGYDEKSMEMASPAAGDAGFTPVEQEEIDATKDCIPKEKSSEVVKGFFNIPAVYRLTNARLYEAYAHPGQRLWALAWEKGIKGDDEEYGSISAEVDAMTSELLSYRYYDYSRYDKDFTQIHDRTGAQEISEKFLERVQPLKSDLTELEDAPQHLDKPEEIREHSFSYVRYVEGIPYPANGFTLNVDSSTGDIVYFNMSWTEPEFPSPVGVCTLEDVQKSFFDDVGLKLAYVGIYNPESGKTDYRLVYKLNTSVSHVFDAFDFAPLDSSGKPIEKREPTVFSDIEGHWAQGDIELLVDLGIISSKEKNFKPDEDILMGDFVKLLMIAQGQHPSGNPVPLPKGVETTVDEELEQYFSAAKKLGWVKEAEFFTHEIVARQKAAPVLIRALGHEEVASLSDIFAVPSADASGVPPTYKGHMAIALGLGLLGTQEGNALPEAPLSNAEAATVIVRLLKLNN